MPPRTRASAGRPLRLEIGGGLVPWAGYTNLDPIHGEPPFRVRLGYEPIPLPDASVDAARASHVLEHIPAGEPRIMALNEVHRVLRRGALFEVIVPHFPSALAISEPSHVSFWIPESFDHFTRAIGNAETGIRLWERADDPAGYVTPDEIRVYLRKP